MREAEQAGIYAAEDVNLERRPFQALVGRALDHLHVLEDNRALRGDSARSPIPAGPTAIGSAQASNLAAMPLLPLSMRFPAL